MGGQAATDFGTRCWNVCLAGFSGLISASNLASRCPSARWPWFPVPRAFRWPPTQRCGAILCGRESQVLVASSSAISMRGGALAAQTHCFAGRGRQACSSVSRGSGYLGEKQPGCTADTYSATFSTPLRGPQAVTKELASSESEVLLTLQHKADTLKLCSQQDRGPSGLWPEGMAPCSLQCRFWVTKLQRRFRPHARQMS
jgi:hypothetical protein